MLPSKIKKLVSGNIDKTFLAVNFGCRVNAAETNQFSQILLDSGFTPSQNNPGIIIINTCSVTKKGEYESLSKIKKLSHDFPNSTIIATGCANLNKLSPSKNLIIINKDNLPSSYTHQIKDKFSHTNRYLLKIQSGCTRFCTYCIVPHRRKTLWSLPIDQAITIVNSAIKDDYHEIIITGVNVDEYQYDLSNLVLSLLKNTTIPLISFGSIPLNSINTQFIKLYRQYPHRLSHFLHIPIQSGSDKILKLMRRPYTKKNILKTFNSLKKATPLLVKGGAGGGFEFGTDIIVGFPNETDFNFRQTYNLCQQISFSKIHVFRFSPRPGTQGQKLFDQYPKIPQSIKRLRSQLIHSLISQTTLPSRQIEDS